MFDRWARAFGVMGVLVGCAGISAGAETRRALLVGINEYHAGAAPAADAAARGAGRVAWENLDGAVNDVRAMREVLIANYGFDAADIRLLENESATREAILSAFRSHLVDPARAGDVSVFYYAGHGSRVINSRTTEADGMDETIVPADSAGGAWDIRDKELARLFNDVVDRKAVLTAIFDSCHSGSITRGLPTGKSRSLKPDRRDIAKIVGDEVADPRPEPHTRPGGALVLVAAGEDQRAQESADPHGNPHGAFSLSLLEALRSGPGESAESIYKRTKSLMQAEGSVQEPNLAGPADRRGRALFGGESDEELGGTVVAALSVEGQTVELQGGLAAGLNPGSELVRATTRKDLPELRIAVETTAGLTRATARVIKGDADTIRGGDLFRLERWTPPDEAHLNVWIPEGGPKHDDLLGFAERLAAGASSAGVRWVRDPTETPPTHELFWSGAAWRLRGNDGSDHMLGATPGKEEILTRLPASGAALFVELPAPAELSTCAGFAGGSPQSTVARATSREQAHYVLAGRKQAESLEYAWVRPSATLQDAPLNPLPARSDWLAIRDAQGRYEPVCRKLDEVALRIGKIRAWLTLKAPSGRGRFPYSLALKQVDSGRLITEGVVTQGQSYESLLVADERALRRGVERRYVYLFAIDSNGASVLLFPLSGNMDNRLPAVGPDQESWPTEIPLGGYAFTIEPPLGTDTFVLLTSLEAIPNPDMLAFDGVRQPVKTRALTNALESLLERPGSKTRAPRLPAPVNWSIDRLTVTSRARDNAKARP